MGYRIDNRLTFLHISKAAGTSVTTWIKENYPHKFSGRQHDTYYDLPAEWQDNVFCVIRNPYDRAVSFWTYAIKVLEKKKTKYPAHIKPQLEELNKGFKNYVLHCQDRSFTKKPGMQQEGVTPWTAKSQLRWLPKDLTKIKILRMETLESDFKNLMKKNGLTKGSLPKTNVSSDRDNYRDYYDPETRREVERFYRDDIERFGYLF